MSRKFDNSDQTVAVAVDKLKNLVDALALTDEVLQLLVPGGRPYDFESALWDYKENIPKLPARPNEQDKKIYKASLSKT